MIRRIAIGLVVVIALAFAGFSIFVASRQNLRFDGPLPAITASADSAVIARGHYVVRVLAPCGSCHGDPSQKAAYDAGLETPLSGGQVFDIPPGKFRVPNITPDPETGIGRLSDGQIARALRDGIRHDGRALLPFMEMQGLSDDDLTAVISYLRTLEPVSNRVPDHELSLLGRVILATVLSKPAGPKSPPPATRPTGASLETGRYLVESVALCGSCHTSRNHGTGEFDGPHLGGAKNFDTTIEPAGSWSPPNITRDPATGKLAALDEEAFVARMRNGRVIPGSPMPWQSYQHMDEEDLRAVYRYLASVPPVVNDVGPPFVASTR